MNIGEVVPNFVLKDQNGKDFELYKNLDKPLLLVFYPKDNTPVCSNQLTDYNENLDDLVKFGLRIVGISTDSIESHGKFCNKLKLNFSILADIHKTVSKQFDAINFLGIHKRVLILIGTDRTVKWKVATIGLTYIKADEIMNKLNSLNIKELT